MIIFLFLLTINIFAQSEPSVSYENTFPRDNTFCLFNNKKIEIMIRGLQKNIEPKEKGYGELVYFRNGTRRPRLLSINQSGTDTFRLFNGKNSFCTKSFGLKLNNDTFALLLQRENRPYKDQLFIQFFDAKNLMPKGFLETNYPSQVARINPHGFSFETLEEKFKRFTGKLMINGLEFIVQENNLPYWVDYTEKGFLPNIELTYKEFPYPKIFSNFKDFIQTLEWDPLHKKFNKKFFYHAINHALQKNCFIFSKDSITDFGKHQWKCYDIRGK
jgi:hypothetical protein